jgi:hypothetical protein
MSKSIVRWFFGAVIVAGSLPMGRALAEDAPAAAAAPTVAQKQPAVAPRAARTGNRGTYARTYRRASNNSTARTGRRYSYNYSGVGFPRMEGGLTAIANRTTWGRNP